ncbi:PAAR domain-containing protein [Fulvimonas sp. R45]|uniref:PAAR domain-containing protein n=1 Tax=Fulvimonas sp. R45 TaxID=3045937 RepID=UPI00265F9767|nr:PAAR domain-containing protein [Fulvimonas sp. R45]MDO1530089.1 PAAR domain-containing protein [Fulvimonas sp. R45]
MSGAIRLGDKTTGGGTVISCQYDGFYMVEGKAGAVVGDKATCQKHGGTFSFVEGDPHKRVMGRGIVHEGHKLACGCTAISSTPLSHVVHPSAPVTFAPVPSPAPAALDPASASAAATPPTPASLPDSTQGDQAEHGGDYFLRLYIQGDGTTSGQGDNSVALATGSGDSGMVQRVQDAFYVALQGALQQFTDDHSHAYAQAIELDIFGFSRGAAEARHFLHEVNQRGLGPLGDVIPGANLKLKPGFAWKTDLRAGFVGLFDTVSHLGALPDTSVASNAANGFYLCLPEGCATRGVVHLTARDECRVNFPLTSAAPPYHDLPLPGAHSDIGGGYLDGAEEVVWLIRPILGQDTGTGPLETTRPYREAQKQLARLQAQDPANAAALRVHAWSVATTPDAYRTSLWGGMPTRTVAATVEMRRTLSNAYAGVPLRAMYTLAMRAGIPWAQSPDDMPSMHLPDELWTVLARTLSYVQGGGSFYLSPDEEQLLRQRYLHHSDDWHISNGMLYINRPTADGKRVVLSNEDNA